MDHEDRQLSQWIKETLKEEIPWESVRRDKDAFISKHFEPEKRYTLRPHVRGPVMAFAGVLLLFLLVMPQAAQKPEDTSLMQWLLRSDGSPEPSLEAPAPATAPMSTTAQPVSGPAGAPAVSGSVRVKGVRSDVGTPMIFQRMSGEAPVTVVWVFPAK